MASDFSADIDIDVAKIVREKYGVRAIIYDPQRERIKPHPSGIYINDGIPFDPDNSLATITYEQAEEQGFHKIDLLTNSAYTEFDGKEDLLACLAHPVNWKLFLDEALVAELPQLKNAYPLLRAIKPTSIQSLADVLALMRPAKQDLIPSYLEDPAGTRPELYRKVEEVYFKKSHAIAYATMLVCIVNKFQRIVNP